MSMRPLVSSPGDVGSVGFNSGRTDARTYGSVEMRMPAAYSGPYGVLLTDNCSQVVYSVATDSANHGVMIAPAINRGELV
ncbi:MAG TPA: hypothetical protein VHE81_09565 [Lacipirellulaceae bacterium]|nr:hypothetical protein [Lacipirellulaceae bacterium]